MPSFMQIGAYLKDGHLMQSERPQIDRCATIVGGQVTNIVAAALTLTCVDSCAYRRESGGNQMVSGWSVLGSPVSLAVASSLGLASIT